MKTPRQLLVEQKNKGYEEYWIFLFRRLLFEMLEQLDMDLFADMDESLDDDFVSLFNTNIQRLLNDEPLAHVLGYEWFFGLKLTVNNDVLIPRAETEELVAHVLADMQEYFDQEEIVLADIACGSGAIAIASKVEYPQAQVYASDLSEKAVAVAQKNANDNEADVTFFVGDMATPLIDANIKVDVCVCNPPYIKNNEDIEASVKDFEPHLALFGGDDGLDLYRQLFDQLPHLLKEKSMVALEIGFDQKEAIITEIKQRFPQAHVISKKDIHQKDRMIFMYFNITP